MVYRSVGTRQLRLNFPAAVRLKGPLNMVALERSINEIVKRHEALRTTFITVDGRPVQLIAPTLTVKPSNVNLEKVPDHERETEVRRLATEEARRPFNLAQGPLYASPCCGSRKRSMWAS